MFVLVLLIDLSYLYNFIINQKERKKKINQYLKINNNNRFNKCLKR